MGWDFLSNGGKDVWRSNSLVSSFFSAPYSGLGSVKSETGAASFHNLVFRGRGNRCAVRIFYYSHCIHN